MPDWRTETSAETQGQPLKVEEPKNGSGRGHGATSPKTRLATAMCHIVVSVMLNNK